MIKTSGQYKDNWIVESGLKKGDKIITGGLQKVILMFLSSCRRRNTKELRKKKQLKAKNNNGIKFIHKKTKIRIVISLVLILAGIISIKSLSLEEYPDITPPQVVVMGQYPGASADVVAIQLQHHLKRRLMVLKI